MMQIANRGFKQCNALSTSGCKMTKHGAGVFGAEEAYRQILWRDKECMKLVYLKGTFEQIQHRLQERPHHYMKTEMLQSQFDALEEPEYGTHVDVLQAPEVIVQQIRTSLGV
jgi:gluconokinase